MVKRIPAPVSYRSAHWQSRRRQQLQRHPLCVMCLALGRVEVATVVDHVVPHRGDRKLFYFGDLQSLCKRHHDSTKQQIELSGFARDIGVDGLPLDPNHPFNRTK
jgi:5-methylcytosine-specific restriction protein A